MRLELVPDDDAKAVVAARAPMGHSGFTENDRGIRIVTEDGRTAAAVVFSDYRPHWGSIEFSAIWRPDFTLDLEPLSTGIVAQIGDYAFRQLRLTRVWARTSHKNARAKALLNHIGFTREATHADFYGVGLHAETHRMLRREWERRYGTLKEAA